MSAPIRELSEVVVGPPILTALLGTDGERRHRGTQKLLHVSHLPSFPECQCREDTRLSVKRGGASAAVMCGRVP